MASSKHGIKPRASKNGVKMCFLVTRFSLSKIIALIEIFLQPNHIKSVSSRSLFPVLDEEHNVVVV